MYFWNSYPFVRFSIALILGIASYELAPTIWSHEWVAFISFLSSILILYLLSQKLGYFKLRQLNGVIGLGAIIFIGGWVTKLHYHELPFNHYSHLETPIQGFAGKITSPVNERKNHFRYDFELDQVIRSDSTFSTTGKIHIYIRKDSSNLPMQYGDQLVIYGRFYPIPKPDNPNEFDYKKFLSRQSIFSHAFVKQSDVKLVGNKASNPFLAWAYQLRASASSVIDQHITQSRENGIAKALILGIKDHLDNDLKKAYSAAGAMHVLAVSGLHVGIVYLLIRLLFARIIRLGIWGRYVFALLSISIIWLYASVTGLSPSVLRAGTMFTLVAISDATFRESNIYNTLGVAAFILLLIDPYLIYSVGFQLSFAAVFGIVYLQPKLYQLFEPRFWLLDKAWAITCVSIAAQLATFPLTAYYFHQFPTYFLVSNLIVIPSSFLMLVVGIILLLVNLITPFLASYIGVLLGKFMWLINEAISYVHQLPNSLIEWIYMDQLGLFLTYAIVITVICALHYRSFKTLIISTILGIGFISWNLTTHYSQSNRNELILYEIKDKLAIDHIEGHQSKLYVDHFRSDELELLEFQINPYRLASHLNPISNSISSFDDAGFHSTKSLRFGQIASKKFILFDSTTFHLAFKNQIKTDFIIINNGSVKSFEWLAKNFSFSQIILSNQNSRYYVEKMKNQGQELNLKIHSMKDEGAFIFPLQKGHKKRAD